MTTTPTPTRETLASLLAALHYGQYADNEEHASLKRNIERALEDFDIGRCEFATPAEIAQPATPEPPQASAPSVQVVPLPEDLFTHRLAWLAALCEARDRAAPKTVDSDDAGYWQHEIDTFHRIFNDLAQASALQAVEPLVWIEAEPAAKGVDLRTVAKGLLLSTCWHWQADRPTPKQPDNVLFPLYASPTAQPATPREALMPAGWISVEDRMPEPDSGEVLVWLTGGRCAFDEWHMHREDPLGMSTTHTLEMGLMWRDYEFEEVTHWMPLPAAPAFPVELEQPEQPLGDAADAAGLSAPLRSAAIPIAAGEVQSATPSASDANGR